MPPSAAVYSSDCREEPPKATWKLNSNGIDLAAFKDYIANLPERTVCNVRRMNSRDCYLYDAVDPFVKSEVNDLVAFSAEFKERRSQHPPIPRTHHHHRSGSGGFRGRRPRRPRDTPRDTSNPIIQVDVQIVLPNQNIPVASSSSSSANTIPSSNRSTPSPPYVSARPSPHNSSPSSPSFSVVKHHQHQHHQRTTPENTPPESIAEYYQPLKPLKEPWSPVSGCSSPRTL
ncbi:hypothetical protein BDD12DRAFT_847843 [Trichophaea hybrida]|nr:hypothetical protein BDD12DRAFT_847843 [Trichophaea hybrida]